MLRALRLNPRHALSWSAVPGTKAVQTEPAPVGPARFGTKVSFIIEDETGYDYGYTVHGLLYLPPYLDYNPGLDAAVGTVGFDIGEPDYRGVRVYRMDVAPGPSSLEEAKAAAGRVFEKLETVLKSA